MMIKGERNAKIDPYFNKLKKWKEEFALLREIVLDCGLKNISHIFSMEKGWMISTHYRCRKVTAHIYD